MKFIKYKKPIDNGTRTAFSGKKLSRDELEKKVIAGTEKVMAQYKKVLIKLGDA